jgi:peptide/nickel transport system permease protein
MASSREAIASEIGAVALADRGLLFRLAMGLLRFVRHQPLGAFAGVVVLALIFVAIFNDVIAPYRYDEINVFNRLQSPSSSHFFGTDNQGRDIFSRILYGAQTSVIIGFGAVAVSTVVASSIGIISGYYGGLFDLLFQRLVDTWQAFPGLIFLIFVVSIFGSDRLTLILALGLLFSAGSSRVIRSAAITIKQNPYVEAAKVLGANDRRIMLLHILPNVIPIILISISVQIGFVILIESTLSFLGFGIPPPFPSWGAMLQDGRPFMEQHPYLAIFPGAAIALTVYSLNMLGDAVRDVLDPRLRGAR